MNFFDHFRRENNNTASVAKERLQIIVAHERNKRTQPDYLPQLQQEILEVIKKYVNVEQDDVNVQLDSNDSCSVLELNVTLPQS